MKINGELLLRAGLVAAGVLLGTGGTITTQKAIAPAPPQILHIKPECPAIYLDNVRIQPRRPGK